MDRQREGSIASSSSLYQSDSDRSTALAEKHHGIKRPLEVAEPLPEKKRRIDVSSEGQTPRSPPRHFDVPDELWKRIFSYSDPFSLGKLLVTSKRFHSLLTKPTPLDRRLSIPEKQELEDVWRISRQAHCPLMPKPLIGKSELEMWQLLGGRRCQFCRKLPAPRELPPGLWDGGPGKHGLRIVWPFGIRCCSGCLEERSQTDASLLLSAASESVLMPGLPFIFLTQSSSVVPASFISFPRPEDLQITKHYFQDHIEELQREFEQVRSAGPAMAANWHKSLAGRGKERMKDAARWESFETKGGITYIIRSTPQASQSQVTCRESTSSSGVPDSHTTGNYGTHSAYDGYPGYHHGYPPAIYGQSWTQSPATSYYGYPAHYHTYPQSQPTPPAVGSFPPHPHSHSAHAGSKSSRDATEAKQARKNDIERRCAELDDPIPPAVLQHMESFRAACQISVPMTESAWEVLKPRLLAQRDAAEQIEVLRQQNLAALQVKIEDRRQRDANQKEIKEVLDREWDEAQKPIRAKLSKFADEIIRGDWLNGRSVTKDNSALFASDVLSKVRARFYKEVAEEDEATLAAGRDIEQDTPSTPPTRKLVLENMKWVFDHKVKSITEQYRKELFLCNGEGCEGNFKFYGFEGVIQHYGAKHTNQFSKGNIIVHWQSAEWPEDLPFHSDPAAARDSYFAGFPGTGAGASAGIPSYGDAFPRTSTITPQLGPQGPFGFPPASSGPFPYANGSSASPRMPGNGIRTGAHPGAHQKAAQGWSQGSSPQTSLHTLTSQTHDTYSTYTPQSNHSPARLTQVNLAATDMSKLAIFGGNTNLPENRDRSGRHKANELARDAKYHWDFLSDIQGMSDAVRVYVVLFHVISFFKSRFGVEPNLELFSDALANLPVLEPLLSASSLACRFDALSPSVLSQSTFSIDRGSSYDISSFFSLLKSIHRFESESDQDTQASPPAPSLSWALRMLELPDDRVISELIAAPGMDDEKLHLVAEAFPDLFPRPLPRIGGIMDSDQLKVIKTEHEEDLENPALKDSAGALTSAPRGSNSAVQNEGLARMLSTVANDRVSSFSPSSGKSPLPFVNMREDEYDPTHPAIQPQNRPFVRSTRQRRDVDDDIPEAPALGRTRQYVDVDRREMFEEFYQPLPPGQYVRAIPISPRQSRAMRLYYSDAPDLEYIPVEREYARIGPTSPRMYYREESRRIPSEGARFHEGERYLRTASRSGYVTIDRYITSAGPEKSEAPLGRNGEGPRDESKLMTKDHTTEADAGYRSRSNLPSELPPANVPASMEGAPEPPSSLPSGAHTPVPTGPLSGAQSPSDISAPRDARLAALDSGYRGRSLVHDADYADHLGAPPAMIRRGFPGEPYRRGELLYRNRGSKYGRYEAQRRRLQHERTPSPPRYGHLNHSEEEVRYLRDQDVYYEPEPRFVRMDDRARGFSPSGVRYLPGDAYVAEYSRPVEYVRVRDPYSQRYVSGRSGGSEFVEYAPPQSYDREPGGAAPGMPVYDGRHYVQFSRGHSRRERNEPKRGNAGKDAENYEAPNAAAPRGA